MTGVIQLVEISEGTINIIGKVTHVPLLQEVEIKIMQYGDLSSLAVEYPDYNSLGDTYFVIHKIKNNLTTSESIRFSMTL